MAEALSLRRGARLGSGRHHCRSRRDRVPGYRSRKGAASRHPGVRYAEHAAAVAGELIESGVHEAIVTSGPPHMAHEAGRLAARASGLPLVMDMRDPWSFVERVPEHLASPVWLAFAKRFERRAVADATIIATNTEPFRRAMCDRYPNARARIMTVMHGCDEEAVPPSHHRRRFIIGYAGAIYLDRDPRPLFHAAARVVH